MNYVYVRCVALDLPGLGASGGEFDVNHATVASLAETMPRTSGTLVLDAFDLTGHDNGGRVAQRAAATVSSCPLDSVPVV